MVFLPQWGQRSVFKALSANQTNYNLFTAVGSPTEPVNVTLHIQAGVNVYSTSTGNAGLIVSGFHPNSIIKIVNDGTIWGQGGKGGDSGVGDGFCGWSGVQGGSPGGDAISLGNNITIDNTNGFIYSGGGGAGAGGCAIWCGGGGPCPLNAGGGGGGGAGFSGGAGGAAGVNNSLFGGASAPGAAGSSSGGGAGGAQLCHSGVFGCGGVGGGGGGVGQDGAAGAFCVAHSCGCYGPGAGGAAGFAVRLNGKNVTFTGGNNPTQLKGAVG